MIIYIDNEFKCHVDNAEGRRAFEVKDFDNKSITYIEGYSYIPENEVYIRSDGVKFTGEMIYPWKIMNIYQLKR